MERSAGALASLVGDGVLDGELAALVVLLLSARVPVVVAGHPAPARDALAAALVDALPGELTPIELAGGSEEFEWLPEAVDLGWRRQRHVLPATGLDAVPRASSRSTVIVARDLAGTGSEATGGERARLTVRALAVGYGLVATIDEPDLAGVLERLARPPVNTDEDERSRLGVVLAVGDVGRGPRVLAAHYVRPVARDQHGHVQRLPPAVLATWNMTTDAFDHFAWGVLPELADRIGRRPVELEREQARLAAGLRAGGVRPTV